jgi:hypothetical protein
MKKLMKIFIASYVVSATVCMSAFAQDKPDSKVMTGEEILKTFQDKKITDNVHYKYQLHEGGRLEGVEMYSRFTGKWYINQDQLCWLVDDPQATEECFTVQRKGEVFRFSSEHASWDGSVYPLDNKPPPQPEKI